jgi:CHAD domain-containing protein
MRKAEIGEFLYRFYRKRTWSFLANIYKASITTDSKDIHRARLDVKKIFALYDLFELLDPHGFRNLAGHKLFRPLYRQAGKIREIQVNQLLLSGGGFEKFSCDQFSEWIRSEESRAVKKFVKAVKKFKESGLDKTDKDIRKICHSSTMFKMRSKTGAFIRNRAKELNKLQDSDLSDRKIHQIRILLKSISTITTLVYSLKPSKPLDLIITSLNKNEMMIGDWHDRVVLREAIGQFVKADIKISGEELEALENLKTLLDAEAQNFVLHFMPEVRKMAGDLLVI